MNFISNFNLKIYSGLYSYLKNHIFFILPLIIIFSSLKIYGYVFVFFFFVPYIYKKKDEIFLLLKQSYLDQKIVFLYCIFLILQTLFGSFYLKDVRVILFWIPFFVVLFGVYFKNLYDLKYNKFYSENYTKILFISSLVYFIIYFVLNIFAFIFGEGFYSIQDNFWIGSSSAFSISSLLFFSMYKLWESKKFKIFSFYTSTLMFYIFHTLMNETRTGVIYIISITLFTFLRSIQLKKYFNAILIISIVTITYSTSSYLIGEFQNNYKEFEKTFKISKKYSIARHKSRTIVKDARKIFELKDSRANELFDGYQKFKEYPNLYKVIGTGWYSSRITRNLDKEDIGNLNLNHLSKKAHSMQAIIALILDTGIFGVVFLGYIYFINFLKIFDSRDFLLNRLFYICMLFVNFACLFVGYPLVNIAYVLFIFPKGIINMDGNNTQN